MNTLIKSKLYKNSIHCCAVIVLSFSAINAFANEDVYDPLESVNRIVYKINDVVDKATLKPIAKTYQSYTPDFLQLGVSNFFNNIRDFVTLANEV